jgi:protoporphyrinogen oxidase
MTEEIEKHVVVIGAGPAGLTAAYELLKHNLRPTLIEKLDKVGGLARTENYKGFYFDMGGHRFFTKSIAARQMWNNILGHDFLLRPRLSRIFYNNKFYYYPLGFSNALFGLGLWQSILVVLSYIRWQIFPYKQEETFEQWVTNRFGRRLFEIFFKTYTEKVWGIPCSELKAEWAAQRIKDLSLKTAILNMFVKSQKTIKSLIEEFNYPRLGPGMLWERVKNEVVKNGVVHLNSELTKAYLKDNRIEKIVISRDGTQEVLDGTDFISSMPVSEFVQKLDPVPMDVLEAAKKLKYRDFLTVCLIINKPHLFQDNWIYVHSPEVKVGRIQNFKNWSPDMVPDPLKTSLGLEYFCQEGDELWNMSDADLVELGKKEIERIGLANNIDVEDGCVFRVQKAYPIYDSDYKDYLACVRGFVERIENFQTIGRNGLHRYNNQDHSMITGMLAVRNLILGEKNDVWSVNTDLEYHEEISVAEAEAPDITKVFTGSLTRIFARLDPVAFGLAAGIISGLILFLATMTLVIKGGAVVGPNLQLLSEVFPGYKVNYLGSFIGLLYAFGLGFFIGSVFAYLRNLAVYVSAMVIHRDIELNLLKRFLDYM